MEVCAERVDKWAEVVKTRLLHVHDLPAAEATYHQSCSVNFRTKKQVPQQYASSQIENKKRKVGRPEEDERREAFLKVIQFLQENDDEQVTVLDLVVKMNEYLGDSGAYSRCYTKKKLEEHFGKDVIITDCKGKANHSVVTLRSTAKHILKEFHGKQQTALDPETESENIVRAAAKLIKSDIKLIRSMTDEYPLIATEPEANTNILPRTLKFFLDGVVFGSDKIKVAAIGQAIMQAARPRVFIAPLQIGLGVQLHHNFASRFLIDILHRLGFCSSYKEVQTFNESAAVDQGSDIPSYSGEFVQYIADNVDHDIRTLDGRNTFHGMGNVATVTPGTKRRLCVPRQKVTPEEIAAAGQVKIVIAKEPRLPLVHIKYNELVVNDVVDPTANLDVLWKVSLLFGTARTAWSGLMQSVQSGSYQGESSIHFLPMIDMNPSDLTCINLTLMYVANHAIERGVKPILTFDQPLWWKSYTLIESEPADSILRQVILRLGGFHTQMSYLGSIGHLMAGSGLRELMELVYASNAVAHILCYYYSVTSCDLVFKPEMKVNARRRIWVMKRVKTKLGEDVCANIFFIHALLGCDTTSRLFGIGKGTALKKLIDCSYFREQASVFNGAVSVDDVVKTGENALVSVFNGRRGEKLDSLRYRRYCEKLATRKAHVQPQSLPPTSAAAKYHSMRVYLQVRQWKGEECGTTEARLWGWIVEQGQLRPVMTDKPAAPESLLRIIRCNCSSDCSSLRCTCRKNGLECSPACSQCKGGSCTNSTVDEAEDDNSSC